MKFLSACAAFCFITGCTLNGQQSAPSTGAVTTPASFKVPPMYKELDPGKAREMFGRFPDARVKKNNSFFVEFDREELMQILAETNAPTVKFLVGAYSEGEEEDKQLRPTILLQTGGGARTSKASVSNFAYRYFEGNVLCPPPANCRLEQ